MLLLNTNIPEITTEWKLLYLVFARKHLHQDLEKKEYDEP